MSYSSPAPASESGSRTAQKPIARVLIVDDDSAVRKAVAAVFRETGYETIEAHDGAHAMTQFDAERPDVVLLDVNMPEKNGWQALDAIAKIDPLVPIIVITARPNQLGVATGRGVDALMEKPLDFDILLDAVQRFVSQPMKDRCRRLTDPNFRTEFLSPVH
ncbi:MAG: response regulator [Verrucomicrobia bacterium]|nr:response regulator [Verrucomicrobiota bacterium]